MRAPLTRLPAFDEEQEKWRRKGSRGNNNIPSPSSRCVQKQEEKQQQYQQQVRAPENPSTIENITRELDEKEETPTKRIDLANATFVQHKHASADWCARISIDLIEITRFLKEKVPTNLKVVVAFMCGRKIHALSGLSECLNEKTSVSGRNSNSNSNSNNKTRTLGAKWDPKSSFSIPIECKLSKSGKTLQAQGLHLVLGLVDMRQATSPKPLSVLPIGWSKLVFDVNRKDTAELPVEMFSDMSQYRFFRIQNRYFSSPSSKRTTGKVAATKSEGNTQSSYGEYWKSWTGFSIFNNNASRPDDATEASQDDVMVKYFHFRKALVRLNIDWREKDNIETGIEPTFSSTNTFRELPCQNPPTPVSSPMEAAKRLQEARKQFEQTTLTAAPATTTKPNASFLNRAQTLPNYPKLTRSLSIQSEQDTKPPESTRRVKSSHCPTKPPLLEMKRVNTAPALQPMHKDKSRRDKRDVEVVPIQHRPTVDEKATKRSPENKLDFRPLTRSKSSFFARFVKSTSRKSEQKRGKTASNNNEATSEKATKESQLAEQLPLKAVTEEREPALRLPEVEVGTDLSSEVSALMVLGHEPDCSTITVSKTDSEYGVDSITSLSEDVGWISMNRDSGLFGSFRNAYERVSSALSNAELQLNQRLDGVDTLFPADSAHEFDTSTVELKTTVDEENDSHISTVPKPLDVLMRDIYHSCGPKLVADALEVCMPQKITADGGLDDEGGSRLVGMIIRPS